jgi:hypothetical protein
MSFYSSGMAENPFTVTPPNAYQALLTGMQAFDRSRQKVARQSAMERMLAGDTEGALAETMALGDADSMKALASVIENRAAQQFRRDEAARQGRQFDISHRLDQARLGLQQRQLNATLEGQKVPAGFMRGADGALMPAPGGPADPAYLEKVAGAKNSAGIFDKEQKLRKEFEAGTKPFMEVRRGYDRILQSKDDAAGDISLIFGYMKVLDPGSVVREGEFATAQNSAGIPDQVRNIYNRALSGERLNAGQRAMFKGQAGALYEGAKREYTAREQQMRGIAGGFGLDPSRVIPSIGSEPAAGPLGAPPPPPAGFQALR